MILLQLAQAIFSAVGLTASAPVAQTSTSAIPLVATITHVDASRRTVSFTLRNTGTKAVTAWHVAILIGDEPDAAAGGFGTDGFRQFERLGPGEGYIQPNATISATADLPKGTEALTPVVVTPDAAVFADTSFVGKADYAQWVFGERHAQLDAWQEIASRLQDARGRPSVDARTLDALLSAMDSSIAQNGADIVRRTFRANVALRLSDVRAGRAQTLPILMQLLAEASSNIRAATLHIHR